MSRKPKEKGGGLLSREKKGKKRCNSRNLELKVKLLESRARES